MATVAALALAGLGALGLYAGLIEPRRLVVRRHAVPLPGLTAPLRIVAIADLQPWRIHLSGARLRAAFAQAQAERPDLVLWLGDYYNAPSKGLARMIAATGTGGLYAAMQTPFDHIAAAMGTLTAPMGAYAILGNHDWAWSGEATARGLEAVGVQPLIGETVVARHPATGAAITLVGLDDASADRPHGAERLLPVDPPAILLTHAPDVWSLPEVAPLAPALTLAGHSHGGQVAPPGIGPLRLTDLGRLHPRGWYARDGQRLFTSVGMGCSGLPVRLGVPPEIVVLDLRPAAA
jgi:predicted MPP superfamily phosphohydrolase